MKLAAILLALGLLGGSAAAGPPAGDGSDQTFSLTYADKQIVEQQTEGGATQPDPALWVTNPYDDRAWDADDQLYTTAIDPALLVGEPLTGSAGVVGDDTDHLFRVTFQARPRRAFAWQVALVPGGDEQPATLIRGEAVGTATVCILGPHYQEPLATNPHLAPIPNSGAGGYGVFADVFGTMVAARRVKDARIDVAVNVSWWAQFTACGNPDGSWTTLGGCCGHEPRWRWKIAG